MSPERKRAMAIIAAEDFDAEVERLKTVIRAAKWWHRFIPFTITITRRT